ncbi:hypothetical protein BDZ89DRAFT_1167761 [Hymenopellis radicata]|nr:hypothetical protein BDZ89DRAFT_1167761 [Hymenopellis radicata]
MAEREDRLLVSDPKARTYLPECGDSIPQADGSKGVQSNGVRQGNRLCFVRGPQETPKTSWSRLVRSRAVEPVFLENADQLCQIWTDILVKQGSNTANIEVTNWLSRGAIDVIGEAAFKYQFNSLSNEDNILAKAYDSMLVNTFGLPTRGGVLAQQALVHLPASVFWLLERLPSRSLKGLKDVARVGDMVTHQLIKERRQALEQALESPPSDVLSLLCPYLSSHSDLLEFTARVPLQCKRTRRLVRKEAYRRRAFGEHEDDHRSSALEDLWGENPDQFKPERWLGNVSGFNPASSPFGIYSGLVLEIQVFFIKIIQSFSLKYPKDAQDIVRAPSGVMAPVLPGQGGKKLVLEVVSVLKSRIGIVRSWI